MKRCLFDGYIIRGTTKLVILRSLFGGKRIGFGFDFVSVSSGWLYW